MLFIAILNKSEHRQCDRFCFYWQNHSVLNVVTVKRQRNNAFLHCEFRKYFWWFATFTFFLAQCENAFDTIACVFQILVVLRSANSQAIRNFANMACANDNADWIPNFIRLLHRTTISVLSHTQLAKKIIYYYWICNDLTKRRRRWWCRDNAIIFISLFNKLQQSYS